MREQISTLKKKKRKEKRRWAMNGRPFSQNPLRRGKSHDKASTCRVIRFKLCFVVIRTNNATHKVYWYTLVTLACVRSRETRLLHSLPRQKLECWFVLGHRLCEIFRTLHDGYLDGVLYTSFGHFDRISRSRLYPRV